MKKILTVFILFVSIFGLCQKKWSLEDCIEYAKKNNLQIAQNTISKKIQDKNLEIAKREYLPVISGNFNNSINFGQAQYLGTNVRNDNFKNTINVGASVLLYNNRRLEKSVRKAEFEVEASQYDIISTQNNISVLIIQQYLTILLNKEKIKIFQSSFENAQKIYDRSKITTNAGTTSKTIEYESAAALSREKQNLKTAEIETEKSLFMLSQLLQMSNYKELDIEAINLSDNLENNIIEKDIWNITSAQPELKAAKSRINSAKLSTSILKTNYYPSITIQLGMNSFYNNLLNTKDKSSFLKQYSNNFVQEIGVSANIPIFNKGITKLQIEQSEINENLAKNNLDQQRQNVEQKIQKILFDMKSNFEIYSTAKENEKSAYLALDFAEKSFKAGLTSIYDVNVARNNYINAQSSLLQSKYSLIFSKKLLEFYENER